MGAVDGPADAVDVLEVGAARACRGREVRGRERAGLSAVAGQAERCRDELEVGDGVGELGIDDGLIRESEGANDVPATRPEDGAIGSEVHVRKDEVLRGVREQRHLQVSELARGVVERVREFDLRDRRGEDREAPEVRGQEDRHVEAHADR